MLIAVMGAAALAGQSFGTALKGWHAPCQTEKPVFERDCAPGERPCAMQHWWSGGTFVNYTGTRVRYYVDDAPVPVDIPLGLGTGSAPDWLGGFEDNGPWSAGALFGKSGVGLHAGGASHGSGVFNTLQIPFGARINITVSLGCNYRAEYFWLILRGRTKASVVLPGAQLPLPPQARLRSFENAAINLAPYAYLPFFNSTAANGAVLFVTLAVNSPKRRYEFLEGCVRASDPTPPPDPSRGPSESSRSTWLLSSGTEDYFLGTFYFDKGQYMNQLAGVTTLCPQPHDEAPRPPSLGCVPDPNGTVRFSAYRVHGGYDPLEFEGGHASTWRNGEPGHGGAAATVNASTFALVYEW